MPQKCFKYMTKVRDYEISMEVNIRIAKSSIISCKYKLFLFPKQKYKKFAIDYRTSKPTVGMNQLKHLDCINKQRIVNRPGCSWRKYWSCQNEKRKQYRKKIRRNQEFEYSKLLREKNYKRKTLVPVGLLQNLQLCNLALFSNDC